MHLKMSVGKRLLAIYHFGKYHLELVCVGVTQKTQFILISNYFASLGLKKIKSQKIT